jgi:hypothetical protein
MDLMKPVKRVAPAAKLGLVIPGRRPQVASPESITFGRWLWIPGSRAKARAPE